MNRPKDFAKRAVIVPIIISVLFGTAALILLDRSRTGAEAPEADRFDTFGALVIEHTQGKYKPITVFEGVSGLIGIASQSESGHVAMMWATADAKHLITGKVLNTQTGEDMTAHYGMRVAPSQVTQRSPRVRPADAPTKQVPTPPPVAAAPQRQQMPAPAAPQSQDGVVSLSGDQLSQVVSAGAVHEATSSEAPVARVFYDALCGHCQQLHAILQPAIAAGEIQVHWIPVAGVGGQSSLALGSGLLATDAGQAAEELTRLASNDAETAKAVVARVNPESNDRVIQNTQLLATLVGQVQTPVIVYETDQGPKARIGYKPNESALAQIEFSADS